MLLFILFVLMPILEIALLVTAGERFGAWPVIAMVVLTAIVGTLALRAQGFATMRKLQSGALGDLSEALTDGLLLMVAGVLLLTPGFVTDGFGLALLVPAVRRAVARYLKSRVIVAGATAPPRRGADAATHAEPADAEHPFARTRASHVRRDADDATVIDTDEPKPPRR